MYRQLGFFACFQVFEFQCGDARIRSARLVAKDILYSRVPDNLYFRVGEEAVLRNFFSAQGVTAMNERNFAGEVSQEQGFFDCRVAAANDCDFLATEEESITGGAGGNAKATE